MNRLLASVSIVALLALAACGEEKKDCGEDAGAHGGQDGGRRAPSARGTP